MYFNSIPFLLYMLPLFLAVYYIVPRKWQCAVLVSGSLLFYYLACGNRLWCLLLLMGMTGLTYLAGRSLGKRRNGVLLAVMLVCMTGLLVTFKLVDGGKLLPAGLSFYLFQMSAYLIDVNRRRVKAEPSLLHYGVQTTMFPKLLSGPLVTPARLAPQSRAARCTPSLFRLGLQELILGLTLKVMLADRLGGLWGQVLTVGHESISTPYAWMALIAYALRLYFDFHGYSLMATGLGLMLGYHLPRNFNDPYSATSVSDFYRRWHISLNIWFRDYVYIPLGGSRAGAVRTVLNLIVVWLMTGFWHGTGGNYLIWAMFLALLIVNEKLWLGKLLKRTKVVCHVYTVFVILLSWVPFAIGDWGSMTTFLGRLFGAGSKAVINGKDYSSILRQYAPLLACGVLFATPYPRRFWNRIRNTLLADVLAFILFVMAVFLIATSAQDPFMYFSF